LFGYAQVYRTEVRGISEVVVLDEPATGGER